MIENLPEVLGSYREKVDLSRLNWFNVGGEAEVLFRPTSAEDLSHFLKTKSEELPVTVIGVGSNLLVRDGGIEGVVVRLGKGFTDIEKMDGHIHAGAGALSFNVATYAQSAGAGGLEFLSGIPGTIGGALAMNAGCYGGDVASCLVYAEAVDDSGTIHRLYPEDIGYIYRGNTLPDGYIFTKGVFKSEPEDPDVIKVRIDDITQQREDSQPLRTRTSGSTFRNPEGTRAWELIDAAGCRGLSVGDAQISEKHCNFLINHGEASANDIEQLGEEVRKRVKEHSGVDLEWEIKRIGK